MIRLKQITGLAQHYAGLAVSNGDHVVDATAGNGYDTLFLAGKVGTSGHVYAFDIQEEALIKTGDRLKEYKLEGWVTLYQDGHENLLQYVQKPISVAMYNLGYLPKGDRQITTKHQTVIQSLKQALTLLKPGGIVTIVLYPGHEQGAEEKNHILPVIRALSSSDYAVLYNALLNQGNDPPELIVVQKNNLLV